MIICIAPPTLVIEETKESSHLLQIMNIALAMNVYARALN